MGSWAGPRPRYTVPPMTLPDDLLGRIAPAEIFLHLAAQLQVDPELGRFGPARALIRQCVRRRRAIPTTLLSVARQLAADRRWVASQPARDRPHRLTTGARDRDLLPLAKRQTPTLEIPTSTRSHPTLRAQPSHSFLPIGTHLSRRVSNELTPRDRSPEHLHNLRNHPVRELRHRTPPFTLTQQRNLAGPGSGPDSAPIAAAPRPRARLRDDRRATQPRSSDDLQSPSNRAGCCDHRANPRLVTATPAACCPRAPPGVRKPIPN